MIIDFRYIILYLLLNNNKIKTILDLETNENFILRSYIFRTRTSTRDKQYPYQLILADRSSIKKGQNKIRIETEPLSLKIEDHYEEIVLNLMNIKHDIILEKPWLSQYNPIIN